MFDQGIEALSKSVASMETRKHEDNKSMTLSDLMIKVSFVVFEVELCDILTVS